ncbi:hypothetical protein B0H15DRAFT_953455 [Mycena belliarum]|uniref:Uncharacterized protein n=1 Tax=Mycena belliarum TaxID=1033014 RepID=A0AAD6TY90_9AGAR|nr:hypothetical protein B0H15DRAFT_953455 [Mycena belliae]
MKFLSYLGMPALLATTAFAQRIAIGAPLDGASVTAGSSITVEVDRPDTLTGSREVAIVIGFLSCSSFPASCPPPSEIIGSILYNGPYDPEFHTNVSFSKPPHQNFTVTVPPAARKGVAQLSVTHFSLVGAGPFPFLETVNITVNVD